MVDLEKKAEERINESSSELRKELAKLAESQKLVFEDSQ